MLKILLLEDDNTISFAIKKYLEKFKYSVKIFKTISACLLYTSPSPRD